MDKDKLPEYVAEGVVYAEKPIISARYLRHLAYRAAALRSHAQPK